MAQFFWRPNDADVGGPPTDIAYATPWHGFSRIAVNKTSDEEARLELEISAVQRSAFIFTHINGVALGDLSDVELYMEAVWSGSTTGSGALLLRTSGAATTENGYAPSWLRRNNNDHRIVKYDNGAPTTPATEAKTNNFVTEAHRARMIGSTLQSKAWVRSEVEPVGYSLSVTDTDYASGGVGILQFGHNSSFPFASFYAFGIGTDGDPAPTGPIAPPIWTPSMFAAVVLAADVSVAVTLSRPVATISAGAWLPLSGTDLHAMINDEVADLDTWIYADEPTTTRLELGNVSLPALAARALKYYAGGTNGGLKVRLYEGATLIAERTHATLPTTPTQYAMTLTEGELTALTDGTNMFVELESIA